MEATVQRYVQLGVQTRLVLLHNLLNIWAEIKTA
jgi:hypothetical protein